MTTQLKILRDSGSIPLYTSPFSDLVYNVYLAANVDTTVTVPAGVRLAITSGSDFYRVSKSAITLPTLAAGFSAAAGELAKEVFPVTPGDVLHFRSRNATDVSVAFFS